MSKFEIKSPAFEQAELHSENVRVSALLAVFAGLLVLVLIRGIASLAQGYRGEAWRFALLLAAMTAYEVFWRRFVRQAIETGQTISEKSWQAGVFVESLLPTVALILLIHTSSVGPQHALTSPVIMAYFIFIVLSTLHLDKRLSRLSGECSAAGYAGACIYAYLLFPETAFDGRLISYATSLSYAGFLLLGGYAAGAVAHQIRLHVVAALREAESRAKIAQLEHELDMARSIQQGLLPKSAPQIDGFDIAGWNRPADETGGDYFDWQPLDDGRIAFTIADVTGHGISSALGMAACRAYARASLATEADLRCVLARLNHLLYEDLPAEKFVTLAFGVLDPDEGTLELVSAGHGPLLFFLSAENRFRHYDAQGLPLGLLQQSNYGSPQVLRFSPGDILVLVTDGFIEWANVNDEDFGQNRLMEVVRANRDRPAANIISELYSAALKFSGPVPQADDLTALIVKRL
jgi:serine phosphatase RsbU (regulator of sigma subunit)